MAQWLTNPTRNHEVAGLIPGLAEWRKRLEGKVLFEKYQVLHLLGACRADPVKTLKQLNAEILFLKA